MAISRISSASAQAASVAITTPTKGDLILVFAHRDGSITAPSLITGYTNVASGGANLNSARLMWKISDGTETGTGTSTNATSIACIVYRGQDPSVPVGGFVVGGAASVTIAYNTFTFQVTRDTSSWVAGFAGHRTATDVGQAPAGMTLQTSATDIAGSDTNGPVASWSTNNVTVNANSGWRSYAVEIRAAQTAAPSPDPLVQYASSTASNEVGNTFVINFPNTSLANNLLVLCFTHRTGISVTSVTDSNSTAWTAGPTAIAGVGNHDSRLYYLPGAPATVSVTVVMSANAADFIWAFSEFNGPATSSVVDGTATGATSSTQPIQSGSITTTQAGDLIYQYAQDVEQPFMGNSATCSGIAADGGFALLHAERRFANAAQYALQASAGAINPGLTFRNAENYNSLTIAFKMNGSGTSPGSGIRIKRLLALNSPEPATVSYQFPCSGNLLVLSDTNSASQNSITINADNQGNTYTKVAIDTTGPQQWYAANASPSLTNIINMVQTVTGSAMFRMYDIVGAAAAPYDTSTFASGTQTAQDEDIVHAPDITPTTSNGLVIAVLNMGDGPPSSMINAGDIFDNSHYTSETDTGLMNYGDGMAHRYNSSTAAENWGWHTQNILASSWSAQAIAFKAPAGGSLIWNTRAMQHMLVR